MKNELKIHGVYRHYKGDLYIVEDVCRHSETGGEMVLYRALYDDGQLWARPLDMFLGEINRPGIKQKYRFELQEIKSKRKL